MSTNDSECLNVRLLEIAGPADEGTRIYRREGTDEEIAAWFDSLSEHYPDGLVSPGGVTMYAPVSRSGVHKKMKEGKLTAFCFHVTKNVRTFFGYHKKIKERPYVFVPVIECKAWAAELKARPDRQAASAEATGTKLDEDDEFLDEAPKVKPQRRVKNAK